jgi:hypothetical protein
VVQSICFILLIYGIVKIRTFLKSTGMSNQINSRMICLHSVCVSAFLLSNFLLYLEIIIFSMTENAN